MTRRRIWGPLLLLALAGCGGSAGVPVSGTVTLDGKALPGAVVTFHPTGTTKDLGGSGTTGADGKYTPTPARGGPGLPPGDYTVVVSRRLRPDGSVPPPDVPPMESDARETLPPHYSDLGQSILKATVSADKPVHDFPLQKKK